MLQQGPGKGETYKMFLGYTHEFHQLFLFAIGHKASLHLPLQMSELGQACPIFSMRERRHQLIYPSEFLPRVLVTSCRDNGIGSKPSCWASLLLSFSGILLGSSIGLLFFRASLTKPCGSRLFLIPQPASLNFLKQREDHGGDVHKTVLGMQTGNTL